MGSRRKKQKCRFRFLHRTPYFRYAFAGQCSFQRDKRGLVTGLKNSVRRRRPHVWIRRKQTQPAQGPLESAANSVVDAYFPEVFPKLAGNALSADRAFKAAVGIANEQFAVGIRKKTAGLKRGKNGGRTRIVRRSQLLNGFAHVFIVVRSQRRVKIGGRCFRLTP